MQARDRLASFELQTTLMQNLHRRLREEGIVINYPVRTLQFPRDWSPDALVRNGRASAAARGNGKLQRRRTSRRMSRRDVQITPNPGGDSGGGGPGGDSSDLG